MRAGYRVAQEEDSRVLFTFDVAGRTKQATIVHDGMAVGGTGWYVESWARCDLAELPPSVAKAAGVRIWRNAAGELGKRVYVRNIERGLRDYFDRPYEPHAALPSDAVATGYHRGGRRVEVWPSPSKRFGCA